MQSRFGAGAIALVPLVALVACGAPAKNAGQAKDVITVAEAPAATGSIASVFSFSGSVNPRWTVSIVPKAQGQVAELKVQQGQQVGQGEVIAVLDHRALDDQLAQAKANVTSAQAKLNSLLAGARPEDVAAAQANAAAAQAAVANLQRGRPEAIAQAQAALDAAKQKLASAQTGGRAESVAQAQAKLDADQAALSKLDNGASPQDVTNAQLAVEQAKDRLFADQTTDDRLVSQGQMSKEQRQAALDVDQTAIDQANTALAKVTAPPRAEDVAQLQAAVTADQQALAIAKQPNRPEDIAQLQAAVAQAQAALDQAKQPGSAASIAQAQQQANAQRAAAAKAASPYTPEDVAQAKAAVDVAQAAAQSSQTAVDDATVTAPAAGTITDVPIAVGSIVGPGSPIATLISPDLEVDASVEESQVGLFKDGEPASIAVAAPAQPVIGKVNLVSPAADPKTRKFTVKVAPAVAINPLRAGMSATVKIQTGDQPNAILVPKDAVIQRDGKEIVFLDQAGKAKMVTVRTGLADDQHIQITSGVDAGAMVILPGSLNLADGDAVAAASNSPAPAPNN